MAISGLGLLVRQGPRTGQSFDLNRPVMTIGREAGNDIVLEDPQVSRRHARLTQQGAGYTVEDLGSTNGTFINGQRVVAPTLLNPGDQLGLGDTVVLQVQSGAAGMAETFAGLGQPQYAAPPPPPPPLPGYGAPASYGAPPPTPEKKGPSCWVWGCGCLAALVILVVVLGVLVYFFAPSSIAGPVCDALRSAPVLGSLCP